MSLDGALPFLLACAEGVTLRRWPEASSWFTALVSPDGGEAKCTGSRYSGILWGEGIASGLRACPGQSTHTTGPGLAVSMD